MMPSKPVSKAVRPVVTERIVRHIVLLRGERVVLDVHLAALYEVETRVLKQAVRRNRVRFPEDFMYELSKEEAALMVSQGVVPSLRSLDGTTPFAFTEAGIAKLSSVLNSRKAMAVNVAIADHGHAGHQPGPMALTDRACELSERKPEYFGPYIWIWPL